LPLTFDPGACAGIVAGGPHFGPEQQAVASPEANPHLRIEPHQLGDGKRERRQLVDPHRCPFDAVDPSRRAIWTAEEGVEFL
jgi:hypothetical protein